MSKSSINKESGAVPKQNLVELEKERDFFRDTLNALRSMVSVVKPDGTIVWGNDVLLKLSSVTLEQVKDTSAYDRPEIPESDAAVTKTIVDKVANGSHLELRETFSMTIDGSKWWGLLLFTPILKNGKVEYIVTNTLDITDRKNAEEALRQTKERLEESLRLKDQFVTLVSHDLRSPLASILSAINIIIAKNKNTLDDYSMSTLGKCANSLTSLLEMIGKLLDINRLRSGRIRTYKKFHNTRELIEQVVERLVVSAKDKDINLVLDIPVESRIFVDGGLFGQALQNLVSNAVKFCDRGNTVTVRVSPEDPNTIVVKDDGAGIDPDVFQKIFTAEPLPKSAGTRGEGGAGLGLSLSQNIMKAHDGTITVKSAHGVGTEFRLALPKSKAVVLVVDDQEAFRLQVMEHLKGMGVGIVEAENGRDALLKLMEVTPQVIITDIGMPVMDGFELLASLRKSSTYSHTPIIVATSDDNIEMRDEAFKRGASDFVVKPIVPSDFVPRVRRFVG